MERSKFGFNAAMYPLLVMFCVLFNTSFNSFVVLTCFAVFGFVLMVEQNKKIAKMTLHATLWLFVWPIYNLVTGQLMKFYDFITGKIFDWTDPSYKFVEFTINTKSFFIGFGSLLLAGFLFLIFFFGILPLFAGKESKLPGKKKIDKLFDSVA